MEDILKNYQKGNILIKFALKMKDLKRILMRQSNKIKNFNNYCKKMRNN